MKNPPEAIAPALACLRRLKPIMPVQQGRYVADILRTSEEWEYYAGILRRLEATFLAMPLVGQTDSLGENAIIHLHYFAASCDWWITERDGNPREQRDTFGLADLGCAELGYISIQDMLSHPAVELDFHWKPITLAQLNAKRHPRTAPTPAPEPAPAPALQMPAWWHRLKAAQTASN